MSMTESEAIEEIVNSGIKLVAGDYVDVEALKVAVKALEEVQQYRTIIGLTPEELKLLEKDEIQTIGEVLKTFSEWYKYRAIGTVSEFRELKEKATEKKPSEIDERAEESFYYLAFLCPTCGNAVIGQPYRPNNCKHCGQKLDWSEGKE